MWDGPSPACLQRVFIFRISPPHFPPGLDSVREALDLVFPSRPDKLSGVCEALLATLVFHHEWIRKTVPKNSPVLGSVLFLEPRLIEGLYPLLICSWEDSEHMHATGVPPHCQIMRVTEASRKVVNEMALELQSVVPMVKEAVKEAIEEGAIESGTVTRSGLAEMLQQQIAKSGLLELLNRDNSRSMAPVEDVAGQRIVSHQLVATMHSWDGKLHRLPKEFTWPDGTPRHMWSYWYLGDPANGYPPFRILEPHDLYGSTRKRLSDLKYLMQAMETEVQTHSTYFLNPTSAEVNLMYAAAAVIFSEHSDGKQSRRPSQLKWRTVLAQLRQTQKGPQVRCVCGLFSFIAYR